MDWGHFPVALLLGSLLVASWLCRFWFFRRFRMQHHARWLAAGEPNVTTVDRGTREGVFLFGKTKWRQHAADAGDSVLVRLVWLWQILEWLFVVGVVMAIITLAFA